MTLGAVIDFFIHKEYFTDVKQLKKARIFVKACLLTSLFSNSYIWSSIYFEYDRGVYLMTFNVVSFLILPFLAKTKIPLKWLGNAYVTIGAFAVIALTYFSGGLWSAIYPWIISIPVLALLVVNRLSGYVWGAFSLIAMIYIGILAVNGVDLPIEYNIDMKTEWFVMVQPGLLLIILFISFVFEDMHTKSLNILELNNKELKFQKDTIATQSIVLEELIEEKNYVIRILAHDLRNPLKNIGGLIEMMKDETDPVQQAEYVKMIKQSSINAQNLVDKVLEMDATEQNETHLELLPIDAVSLLNKVIQSMTKIGKKKQIELQPSNSIDMAMILADEAYLRAVFENLISNAIKFSNTCTKVTVESIIQDGTVKFKVKDEGPGIEPDELDKLFLKFNKLSPRPTAGESSTGLGLYLVKRYVELMKGKVWYDNSASNGATFIVELPLFTT